MKACGNKTKTLMQGFLGACLSLALCAGLNPAAIAFADETASAPEAAVQAIEGDATPVADGEAEPDAASVEAGDQNAAGRESQLAEASASDSGEGAIAEGDPGVSLVADTLVEENAMEALELEGVYVEVVVTPDEHDIQLWVRGAGSMAQSVSFAVWSVANDQDDLQWYNAGMLEDGSWVAFANRCSDTGEHVVHAYAKINGEDRFVGEGRFTLSEPTANVSVIESGNGFYTVRIGEISVPTGIVEVLVPTWTHANGQDDMVWHQASRFEDGSWLARIEAGLHGGQDGMYASHVYVKSANGLMRMVGFCDQEVVCENYIYVTGALGSGQRQVCVKNPSVPYVYVPTWSEANGQDDIVWYPAGEIGNLTWAATIDCHAFKDPGRVVSDVYVFHERVGGISYDVTMDDIIPARYRDMYHRVQGLNSSSTLLLAADTNNCFVGVYEGSQGNWRPIHYFACSPGAWGSPSRKGIFTVGDKGYAFGTNVYTCYYYTQYSGDFLFHSILYNAGTRVVQDGRLGMHLSHGCIRLAIENAKWIYDNVPRGSRVLVY